MIKSLRSVNVYKLSQLAFHVVMVRVRTSAPEKAMSAHDQDYVERTVTLTNWNSADCTAFFAPLGARTYAFRALPCNLLNRLMVRKPFHASSSVS